MRILLLFLWLLCLAITSGCSAFARIRSDIRSAIPDGRWASVDAVVTGKFSSTTIKGIDVVKNGDSLTAKELHIRHSNVYVPLVQIDAVGFLPLLP